MQVEPFVDSTEVSRFLGMSKNWLHEQCRSGSVPSYRFGKVWKFRLSEIKAWAEAQKEER